MKRYILALTAIIFIVLLTGIAFIGLGNGKTRTLKGGGILSVNDIQADPYAYKGTITVTGVVAGVSKQDPKIFAIVDTSEAKLCKQTGCASFYLSVKYEGQLPKQWDEVNVAGTLAEGRRPFSVLLTATKVEVLRHLTF